MKAQNVILILIATMALTLSCRVTSPTNSSTLDEESDRQESIDSSDEIIEIATEIRHNQSISGQIESIILEGDHYVIKTRLCTLKATVENRRANFYDIDCEASEEEPSFLCMPSRSRSGQWYIARQDSPNTQIGGYFPNQDTCTNAVNGSYKNFVCMLSSRRPGKAYINEMSGTNNQRSNYFDNLELCIESLGIAEDHVTCGPSERHPGKWYLSNLDQPMGGHTNYYYSNKEACFTAWNTNTQYVCTESARLSGKAFLRDRENNRDIRDYFDSLTVCNQSAAEIHHDHACVQSESRPGSWRVRNLKNNDLLGGYIGNFDQCLGLVQQVGRQ